MEAEYRTELPTADSCINNKIINLIRKMGIFICLHLLLRFPWGRIPCVPTAGYHSSTLHIPCAMHFRAYSKLEFFQFQSQCFRPQYHLTAIKSLNGKCLLKAVDTVGSQNGSVLHYYITFTTVRHERV